MLTLNNWSILASTLLLSGCIFAPGMHMKSHPSSVLNKQDQIVKQEIVRITPTLIQQQRMESQKQLAEQLANYHSPQGFFTQTDGYDYRIGAQDVLTVIVWDHPNLSSPLNGEGGGTDQVGITVDAGGFIYYPYVGYIKVSGKTVNEIRDLLTLALSKFLKDPQVNVSVTQFNSQKVYVTGAVIAPSVIPVSNVPLTVLNAVTAAGGPIRCGINENGGNTSVCADLKNVEVSKGGARSILDLDMLTAIDGSSVNWVLENGDRVYVPTNNLYRIFVLGSVITPGPYAMTDGKMSLKEAIGDARGVTIGSDPTYTYVIRSYQHDPQIFLLDATSPDAFNLAGDFDLKAGDVIFVSASKFETFNSVLGQINPSLITAVSTKALLR